ncbi:uncharacterized protein [Nerophis lumbriciformis]|uniref:uncharacterized protein isoform X2 n=1 Tax=Nerophis lumbriciformis TaxID=546530 RepID=UPI002AE021B5|nr:uncharacterized protein LOC133575123 isoform X2 [Nerophis lumbriciformis]
MLKELVKERLMVAADEIFALFETTMASYEEELSRTREEKEQHRQQLEAFSQIRMMLQAGDIQLLAHRGERPLQPQMEPQPPYIKEEEEELWITQGGECLLGSGEADPAELPQTVVSVKTEDSPPASSQLHHKGAEPPSSSSTQHMTTEADGGSQADNLLAPLSDWEDTTSQDKDWDNTHKPNWDERSNKMTVKLLQTKREHEIELAQLKAELGSGGPPPASQPPGDGEARDSANDSQDVDNQSLPPSPPPGEGEDDEGTSEDPEMPAAKRPRKENVKIRCC